MPKSMSRFDSPMKTKDGVDIPTMEQVWDDSKKILFNARDIIAVMIQSTYKARRIECPYTKDEINRLLRKWLFWD